MQHNNPLVWQSPLAYMLKECTRLEAPQPLRHC